jgi:hypothetical protein
MLRRRRRQRYCWQKKLRDFAYVNKEGMRAKKPRKKIAYRKPPLFFNAPMCFTHKTNE